MPLQSKGQSPNPVEEMIVEPNQDQSSSNPLDYILMVEENPKHPCPRRFRHFKQKPAEPEVCHLNELKESEESIEKESSEALKQETQNEEPKDLMQMIPDLPLIIRGIYPSLISSSLLDSNARGIFKTIIQNLDSLILQPTTWLPKDICMSLNKPAFPVSSTSPACNNHQGR